MKKIAILLLAVLFIATAFGCAKPSITKLVVNEVTHSVFYAPQYVAMSLGYFEEQGLEIELVNGGGSDKSMTAVLSGQADIGLMGPETSVYVYSEGKSDYAMIIGQLTKRDGSFIIGKSQEEFEWENLKGKKVIGGRQGGMPQMTLEHVIKSKGLEIGTDVTVDTNIQFNLMAGAFEGGEYDYVTLFEPTASMFEKEGKGYVLASVGAESGEVPYTAYMVRKSDIEKRGDIFQRYINAVAKAQKWVLQATPAKIAETIAPHFPDSDLEILTMVATRYKEIDAWMTTPVMDEDAFKRLQEIMREAGELTDTVPYDQIVNNTFAKNAK